MSAATHNPGLKHALKAVGSSRHSPRKLSRRVAWRHSPGCHHQPRPRGIGIKARRAMTTTTAEIARSARAALRTAFPSK
jgi:hypothetical protein